jgi:hypothetical protein
MFQASVTRVSILHQSILMRSIVLSIAIMLAISYWTSLLSFETISFSKSYFVMNSDPYAVVAA